MLSGVIAAQFRARHRDAVAVVEDASLVGLSDEAVLAFAADVGPAIVTANIQGFVPPGPTIQDGGQNARRLRVDRQEVFPPGPIVCRSSCHCLDRLLNEESLRIAAVTFLQR